MCEGDYKPGRDLVGEVHSAEDQTPQNRDENYREVMEYSQLAQFAFLYAVNATFWPR